ncbi:sensor histidine kinase [Clostridium grantii]|uniref:GHKL domain-containing protein n=1 Tax=Clostridium grantii DSM 8605 TaxID=1121316 RepID=A0A1M5VCQ7_9CLOT|nr:sensor histidine kinase [Clostridium grantii]SHH72894.1 GHKL domain-containing protein [Clostridium grantii DSM 8605]
MYILINFELTICINLLYNHLFLTRKKSMKYSLVIFIINQLIVLLGILFSTIFFKDTVLYNYALFILGFSFIIYISFVFEESFSKKIFNMFTIWVLSNILFILCSYTIGLFYIKDYSIYKILARIFKDVVQVILIPIIYLYFKDSYKEMLKLVSNKVINIISVYSIMVLAFLIKYYASDPNMIISHYNFLDSMIFVVIIVLSYVIIFIAIYSVNKNVELEYKFKIIDAEMESQKQNYKMLNNSMENYYSFKHDIRHHILTIKLMIDNENYTEAAKYLEKFSENEKSQSIGMICKNFTIDSILKYYMNIAMSHKIDFKVNANIPKDINIDNIDLTSVVSNCVENAVEACANIIDEMKKYINIKAEIKGDYLIFKIKNSFNGQVIEENNILKTFKSSEEHGMGLSNVRKIADKYNGYFKIKYDDNEFEVDIILNYK